MLFHREVVNSAMDCSGWGCCQPLRREVGLRRKGSSVRVLLIGFTGACVGVLDRGLGA